MDKPIGDGNENGAHFTEKIIEVDRTDASAYSEATQFKETISSNELQTPEEIVENEENHSEILLDSNSVMNRSSTSDSAENKHEQLNVHPNKPVEIICKDEVNTEQEDCTTQPTELSEYNSEYMLEQQSAHGFMQNDSQNENNLVEGEHTVEQSYIPEVTEQVSNIDKGQYLKQKSETTDHYAESTDNFISQYESEDNSQTVANLVDDQPHGNPPEELVKVEDVSVKESEYVIENDDSAEISTEEVPNLVLYNESTTDNSVLEDVSSDPIPDNLLIQDSLSHPLPDESDTLLIEEHSSTAHIDPLKNDTDDVQSNDNVTLMAVQISNSNPSDQADETPTIVEYISSSENNDQHVQESVEVIPIQENFSKDDVCEEISSASHSTLDNTENSLTELENMSCIETIVDSAVDQDSTEAELKNDVSNKSETDQLSQEPVTKKPRRTRRSNFEVPMHILGHNIANPLENVPNGRQLPKPRLGVKVPYCNLTSQIVSKADIEREVMKRSRLKQEQAQAKGEVLFARSLTQRLARKLAPSATSKDKDVKNESKDIEAEMEVQKKISNEKQNTTLTVVETIENDSDLLAILEGEGEEIPVLPKEVTEPQLDETNLKLLEREIALQQLQDLPHLAPKQRIYRGRNVKAVVLASESPTPSNTVNSTPEKPVVKKTAKPPEIKLDKIKSESVAAQSSSGKENTNIVQASSPRKEIDLSAKRQPIEIEPQVKVNMVLKTYSRKRKTSDVLETTGDSPSPKKPSYQDPDLKIDTTDITLPTDVYITKSSRVIKKKVIWDPDEVPVRSPKPTLKPVVNMKNEVVKIAKVVDKNSNTEKVNEKKPVTEKSVKSPEKKVAEKVISTSKKLQEKKQIQKISPKITKTPIKPKKILSEIDRLLMDEGAVKMLYELKNTDDTTGKKKKNVYVVGRAQRDIIKKANQIKNELEQNTSNDSAISLRKKEGVSTPSPLKPAVTVERKMSKDSVRSLHTPPCSPFPQGSMLIRRRSSSSISSSDELDSDAAKVTKKKSDGPKTKKFKKSVEEPKDTKSLKADIKKETPQKVGRADVKLNSFSSFTIKKVNKQVTINLTYPADKCFLTVEILEELTLALNKFGNDKDINVMAITSGGKAFCSGLHYGSLVCSKEEERKEKATKLAEKVRDFLLSLLHFPKVLVAGVQGECIGLGVTMLPLFDIIIASDAATFRTPYTQLGCLGEGGFLLSSPKLTNHGLVAELLYTGQTLTADEAFRRGLISRLCWPEKYKDTLKGILTSIANGSKQSLMSTKKELQGNSTTGIEQALNAETKILIEHWTSAECQKNFTDIENEN